MNHHTATTTQAPDDADLLLPPGSDDENPAPVAEPAPATSTTDTTPADDFPDLLPETIVALREQGIDPATWVDPLDIALADVGFDIAKLPRQPGLEADTQTRVDDGLRTVLACNQQIAKAGDLAAGRQYVKGRIATINAKADGVKLLGGQRRAQRHTGQ